jgi:hypothetical protein
VDRIIKRIQLLGFYLINISNSFSSIHNHIGKNKFFFENKKNTFLFIVEFFIKTKEFQFGNHDRSVLISIIHQNLPNVEFQFIFFTISNININHLINSPIVSLSLIPQNLSINNIHIVFRHLNQSNQIPTCAYLRNIEK